MYFPALQLRSRCKRLAVTRRRICAVSPQIIKESLNKSSSAEQRIFSSIRAASKAGNTYSIPPLLNPSSREKSLAVGSRRFNQSFLKSHSPNSRVFCRHEMGLYTRHGCILLSKSHASKIGSTVACGMLPLCPDQKYGTGNFPNR